ncbi:hypothetical protein BZG36_02938 [Bifiguratus adelaidae]|uniref:Secreted protein n=1 Tax=Bifiguratus adelaidae TaxID=1938954 RepID=A0A261Y022_9FUNG|nr:hypothetical protein BZG36_02938 [Bifiguratus adelaidae]
MKWWALVVLAAVAHAVPLHKNIVYLPKILVPDSHTVWHTGEQHVVVCQPLNELFQGSFRYTSRHSWHDYARSSTPERLNEHLNQTLAQGFDLSTGNTSVTVPTDIPTRHDYIIVLFGDSGNASPRFTVVNK